MAAGVATVIVSGALAFGLFGGRGCSAHQKLSLKVGECYAYKNDIFKGEVTGLIYRVADIDGELIMRDTIRNPGGTEWYRIGPDKMPESRSFIAVQCPTE